MLPRYGSYRGKGEALWKSLYATSGDLVAWSDTDIVDWHPRFIYGTLGPLLAEPRIGYVKAYYQRPIVEGGVLKEGGGGRVTELVARPLINLFFPRAVGLHPAALRRVRGPPSTSSRSRSSPATPSRSATSSTSPSASASTASARSTSTSASTATRSSRACRG